MNMILVLALLQNAFAGGFSTLNYIGFVGKILKVLRIGRFSLRSSSIHFEPRLISISTFNKLHS